MFIFARIALVIALAALSACAHWSGKEQLNTSDHPITATEFSRIKTALQPLPDSLKRILEHPELYRASTSVTVNDANAPISLSRAKLDSNITDDNALQRQILLSFFKSHPAQLNLFCEETGTCHDLETKKQQLQLLFRGRYLQSGVLHGGASNDELLANAYAFHAAEFFSDSAYHCKHPLLAKMLQSIWDFDFKLQDCSKAVPFLVSDWEKPNKIVWVDPTRVYAVHLLFAGTGERVMSRFGHVALRLIVCNKDRVIVDRQCEQDIFDHISLGFKAEIDEFALSYWKGITGGYSIKLYAQPFFATYQEYNIDEFRDLYSLPLKINDGDRHFLVSALSEIHWFYQNDYQFFTQNCATEMQWLLNILFYTPHPSYKPIFSEQYNRPDLLFEDATKSNYFDANVLSDLTEAEKSGYYFRNTKKYYQLAVDTIESQLRFRNIILPHTPDEWREQDARFRREYWLMPEANSKPTGINKRTDQAKMVLETWVARELKREIFAGIVQYYEDILPLIEKGGILLDKPEKKLLHDCINLIKTADMIGTSPTGIPQNAPDIDTSSSCNTGSTEMIGLVKKIIASLPFSAELQNSIDELNETARNITEISLHDIKPLIK